MLGKTIKKFTMCDILGTFLCGLLYTFICVYPQKLNCFYFIFQFQSTVYVQSFFNIYFINTNLYGNMLQGLWQVALTYGFVSALGQVNLGYLISSAIYINWYFGT
jgi:hypothetical protein